MRPLAFERTTCIYCGESFIFNECCVVATNRAAESPVRAGTVLHEPPILPNVAPPRGLRLKSQPPLRLPDVRSERYRNPNGGPPLHGSEVLADLACPHCLRPISGEGEKLIALIGPTSSGKSVYITALIDQILHKGTLAGFRCAAHARDDSHDRYMRNYYVPLVERHEFPRPNDPARGARDEKNAPLSFTLVLDRPGTPVRKELSFALFDLPGERLTDPNRRAASAQYVNDAEGLIFFVDPMSLPGFVRYLPERLQRKADEFPRSRIGQDIASVVDMSNRRHGRKNTAALRVPVSVTLSKSDLAVHPCRKLGMKPRFLDDEPYVNGYSVSHAREVSREVRDFLQAVRAQDAFASEGMLQNLMFHAVSGVNEEASVATRVEYEPVRAVDPFLWLLSQWGTLS